MDRSEEILQELRALRGQRDELIARQSRGDLSTELLGIIRWLMARIERREGEFRDIEAERQPEEPQDVPAFRHLGKLSYAAWATYAGFHGHLCETEKQLTDHNREPTWEAVTGLLSVNPRQVERHMQAWGLRPPRKREKKPDWPPSTWPDEPRKMPRGRGTTLDHLGGLVAAMLPLPIGFDLLYDPKVDHVTRLCHGIVAQAVAKVSEHL